MTRSIGILVRCLGALTPMGGIGGIVGMALLLAVIGSAPGRETPPESLLEPLRFSFLLGGTLGLILGLLLGLKSARQGTAPRWGYSLLAAFLLGGLFTIVTTVSLLKA